MNASCVNYFGCKNSKIFTQETFFVINVSLVFKIHFLYVLETRKLFNGKLKGVARNDSARLKIVKMEHEQECLFFKVCDVLGRFDSAQRDTQLGGCLLMLSS